MPMIFGMSSLTCCSYSAVRSLVSRDSGIGSYQSARNIMIVEGVDDNVHPCNTWVNERVFEFETDSSTERKQEKRAQFANKVRVVLAKVLLEELLLSLSLKPLDDSIFIFAFGHSLADAVEHIVIFHFSGRFLNWGCE